eukprot:g20977.t1
MNHNLWLFTFSLQNAFCSFRDILDPGIRRQHTIPETEPAVVPPVWQLLLLPADSPLVILYVTVGQQEAVVREELDISGSDRE